MCFFLFWLISLPAIWFPIHTVYVSLSTFHFFACVPILRTPAQLNGVASSFFSSHILSNAVTDPASSTPFNHERYSRHLFTLKSIVTPIAGMTFFIWCIVKAKGVGPIISQPATIHGSDRSWAMIVSLMSAISNMATLVT